MRVLFIVLVAAVVAGIGVPSARACEPQDAPVYVAATEDGFVFVSRESVLRVRASGEVLGRWTEPGMAFALFPDGRTLLVVTDEGESVLDCMPRRLRLRALDTAGRGPARTVGRYPRGAVDGSAVETVVGDGDALRVGVVTVRDGGDDERSESLRVTPSGRVSVASGAAAAPTPPAPSSLLRVTLEASDEGREDERTTLRVTSVTGRSTVRVALARRPEAWALHADRYLALATYERVNEDYGTGFEARLDVVDLATGRVVTPFGASTGVVSVDGLIAVQCESVVSDTTELNVRSAPRSRAPVTATLADGTVVVVVETQGSWSRLSGPAEGWVWSASLHRRCTEAPSPR